MNVVAVPLTAAGPAVAVGLALAGIPLCSAKPPAPPAVLPRAVATPEPRPLTPVEIGSAVALVSVRDNGVPPAPLNVTRAPAEPTLTPSAVATPVPSPVIDPTAGVIVAELTVVS